MARFIHPLKMQAVSREELETALNAKSQKEVAKDYGVSQMTVCRYARLLGVDIDGRKRNNEEGNRKRSETLRTKYASGEIVAYQTGREFSAEHREAISRGLKGKTPWNAGISNHISSVCEICGNEFRHGPRRKRRFCGRDCAAVHMSRMYSDGRLKGESNPNFGNDAVKQRWSEGCCDDRILVNHGRGKGGEYDGVWMRSSWEREFASWLDSKSIKWEYEPRRFTVGVSKRHTPDFFLPDLDIWIEVKGWWTDGKKEKFEQFRKEHPEIKIIVIEDRKWNTLLQQT